MGDDFVVAVVVEFVVVAAAVAGSVVDAGGAYS